MYEYKFSVIIPIYNLEKYLDKAIKSILKQTIGFKDNIEIILVNDGSTDNSEKICLKYQKKFPHNIIYINQKNSGVSAARNNGLSFSKGKYINFFDGDDFWNKEDFAKVWNFFEENSNDIDVVSCRQKFFEASNKYVALDYKFKKGNQVVNINDYPDYIHASVCSSFFKFEAIKNHRFDTNLKLGEDSKFLNEIILKREKYGLLSDVTHNIRRRSNKTSATQNIYKDKSRYTNTVLYYYEYMYEFSRKKYGKVIPYVQFLIMNAVKYRVTEILPGILSNKEKNIYIEKLISIIKQTDDDVLCKLRNINYSTILLLLKLKYDNQFDKLISFEKGKVLLKGNSIFVIRRKPILHINNLSLNGDFCEITGYLKVCFFEEVSNLFLKRKENRIPIELKKEHNEIRNEFLNDDFFNIYKFKINIKLNKDIDKFKFILESNIRNATLNITFDDNFIKSNKKYKKINKKMVLNNKTTSLIIKNYKLKRVIKLFLKK